jgi:site-specific DNA recombinase
MLKDFRYYRCSGSDGYRFGGERICSNTPIQGELLEMAVWQEISDVLKNPDTFQKKMCGRSEADASLEDTEALKSQRAKLQHALERLIDSFTEGFIEKDQFTPRLARIKNRIAELDAKIEVGVGEVDQHKELRLATERLRELASSVGPHLAEADWNRRREIIRTLVQRIEIGLDPIKIIFRLRQDMRGRKGELFTAHYRRLKGAFDLPARPSSEREMGYDQPKCVCA